MFEFLKDFRAALGFLTILPCGRRDRLSPERLGRFPAFYPLVGLVLGGALSLLRVLAWPAWPPELLATALTVLLLVLTRGFHLDGLADAADGLLSHQPRERQLAIMKDSRQGAFGVLAIVLDVTIKIQLLKLLAPAPVWVFALWPVWGRLGASAPAALNRYVGGENGLGRFMTEKSGLRELALAFLLVLIPSLCCGLTALMIAAAAGLFALSLAWLWNRLLGGLTGDLLGAGIELTEMFSLLTAYILINR